MSTQPALSWLRGPCTAWPAVCLSIRSGSGSVWTAWLWERGEGGITHGNIHSNIQISDIPQLCTAPNTIISLRLVKFFIVIAGRTMQRYVLSRWLILSVSGFSGANASLPELASVSFTLHVRFKPLHFTFRPLHVLQSPSSSSSLVLRDWDWVTDRLAVT